MRYCELLNRRYGFNKQTPRLFVIDLIKSFFIELILEICLYSLVSFVLQVDAAIRIHV